MPSTHNPWRLLAAIIILASAALHLAYFSYHCPLDLAPDEAHYWDWSRHLDWSYYSKGPLVAYLIRAGCLMGGDTMPGVRLPAVLCGSLLLVSLYILTVQVYRSEKLAAAVVGLALTLPVFVAGSSLMTIDAPYTCCWGWALVLGHRAIFGARSAERGMRSENSLGSELRVPRSAFDWWAWPAAGLMVGLGILAKYTMVLWLPSVGLFLLISRACPPIGRPGRQTIGGVVERWVGFWIASVIAGLCCLPILIWNANHGWVTLHHVNGQAGMGGRNVTWHPVGPLVYLGSQFALLLGFWFVAWLAAMIVHRPTVEKDAGIQYLWWMSAPMFAVFLAFSIKNGGGQVNWPVTAYLSGLVLTVAWLRGRLVSSPGWLRALGATCAVGLAASILMHHMEWLYPALAPMAGVPTAKQPLPLRKLDPTCRLRGWQTLATEVDRLRAELEAEGIDPVVTGSGWTLPGELGFYCAGHPTVYSMGLAAGDRRSQYDFWRPNPVWDPEVFRGRTFILVDHPGSWLLSAFDQVEPPRLVIHGDEGRPISCWSVTVARGFRGFAPVSKLLRFQRF